MFSDFALLWYETMNTAFTPMETLLISVVTALLGLGVGYYIGTRTLDNNPPHPTGGREVNVEIDQSERTSNRQIPIHRGGEQVGVIELPPLQD